MKKLMLTIGLMVVGLLSAQAQGFRPRIEAGLNYTHFTSTHEGLSSTSEPAMGTRVGVIFEVGLGRVFYIAPGFSYQMNKAVSKNFLIAVPVYARPNKGEEPSFTNYQVTKLTQHVLSVPFNLGLRFRLNDDLALAVEAGPYAQIGLGFEAENQANEGVDLYKNRETNMHSSIANPGSLGIGAGLALYIRNFYLGVNTQHSLTDLYDGGHRTERRLNSQGFNVSVGYRF